MDDFRTRDEEIKLIWANEKYRFFYRMLFYTMLIGIGLWLGRLIYAAPDANQAWGYGVNLFTGILSTAATVLILDQLAERRVNRKAVEELKRQLVDDAASISNEVAKNAVHQIERKKWLHGENGLLKGENLYEANLQRAKLTGANLQQVKLSNANLEGAYLSGANLQLAWLTGANLQNADLFNAQLQLADLHDTNLRNADLRHANLKGANLYGANLQGARLNYATLEDAILPDGHTWQMGTEIKYFTDPAHSPFWRSDVEVSPAYRGKPEE